MRMGPGNDGPEPPANILRAIRHGVASGACLAAFRVSRDVDWARMAEQQSGFARDVLHHANCRDGAAWAAAKTSNVTPLPDSFE